MITHLHADNWMKSFKNGEQLGFTYLFDKYFNRLSWFGFKMIRNKADCDEVAADSLQKAMGKCAEFPIEEDVRRFLYVIVKNRCIDIARVKERARYLKTDEITLEFDLTDNENVLNEIIRTEVVAAVHGEMALLPKQRQNILKLYFVDEMDIGAIAKKLHLSGDTVRSVKAKGIFQLKELLNKKKVLTVLTLGIWSFYNKQPC